MVPDSGIQKKFSFFAVLVFSGYEHKDLLKNNPRVQDKWILSSFNKRWRYNFWWRYHRTFNHGYNLADCFFNPSGLSGKIKSFFIIILKSVSATTTVAEFANDQWRWIGDLVEKRTGHRAITNGSSVMNIGGREKPEVQYLMSTEERVN